MILKKVLPFSHLLLKKVMKPGSFAVDATTGNGNDTLFLAELVGESGKVFGFDIQEQALQNTKKRLEKHQMTDRVVLYQIGHENVKNTIPSELHGKIDGAIFNLGYLPKSDHTIVTVPDKTIAAVEQLLEILAPEGIIVLVVYHGHPEGKVEKDALFQFVETIDQSKAHVLLYRFLNQKNDPPFVIAIEKR